MVSANPYTRQFIHNLVDPVSGKSWISMQASGCKFDLKKRKLVKASEADLAKLEIGILRCVEA